MEKECEDDGERRKRRRGGGRGCNENCVVSLLSSSDYLIVYSKVKAMPIRTTELGILSAS